MGGRWEKIAERFLTGANLPLHPRELTLGISFQSSVFGCPRFNENHIIQGNPDKLHLYIILCC